MWKENRLINLLNQILLTRKLYFNYQSGKSSGFLKEGRKEETTEQKEMSELNQFCLLASSQKGLALTALIQQVLNSKKIYNFGELLCIPSVQGINSPIAY